MGAPGPDGRLSPRTRHARTLFAGLAERYDVLAEVLSFGQNRRWRRFLVSRVPARPFDVVLDVATGTAGVATQLVRRRGCRVIGIDPSAQMLAGARRGLARSPAGSRISLVRGQAEALPFPDAAFDHVTFTYLLRYVDDPGATLGELARVLRPGGTLACLEFAVPSDPVARGLWELYTRVGLPIAGAAVSGGWAEAGRFLGPSIREFYARYPLPAQRGMWLEAGIADVAHRAMSLGGGLILWGTRRG